MHYEFIYCLRSFPSAGDGSHYETGTVSGITTNEHVVRILLVVRLEESHCEEYYLGFDNLYVASLNHYRTASLWIRFPVYRLYLYTRKLAIFAKELKCVDVPATLTTLLM